MDLQKKRRVKKEGGDPSVAQEPIKHPFLLLEKQKGKRGFWRRRRRRGLNARGGGAKKEEEKGSNLFTLLRRKAVL